MTIGIIGLGRMGYHMAERLLQHKKSVSVYNRTYSKTQSLMRKGAKGGKTLAEFIDTLDNKKRIVWLMLPAGKVTDNMISELIPHLKRGDIIVNGANAFYKNAQAQSKLTERYGIHLFDAGVSGGIHGLERGYALMFGGPKSQFKYIEPFAKVLAPKDGYGYFGDVGAGHYVKSVHNIVEYVYMQGLAEGVELLDGFEKPIDYKKAAKVWQPASIVSSALLDWMVDAFSRKDFKKIKTDIGSVTLQELTDTVRSVKAYAPAFEVARKIRLDKTKKFTLGKRVIAAIRREFGGHAVRKKK
ncbi:MAG: NADP-dependent phosphogluconate dehydrogenase [Patescibacteria group bacterium]